MWQQKKKSMFFTAKSVYLAFLMNVLSVFNEP